MTVLAFLENLEEERVPPMKQIESARSSRRPQRQLTLEESWTSLNVFNQTQKGRISLDLQGQLDKVVHHQINCRCLVIFFRRKFCVHVTENWVLIEVSC